MMQVFIVHRWGGTPKSDWYSWLKSELENNGYKVKILEMPETNKPKISSWMNKLKEEIKPNEKTILVGHSIGCQTILRYLEQLEKDAKIKGTILVAPWLSLKAEALEDEESKLIAKPWLETRIDFEKVKTHTENFVTIFSSNDPFVSVSQCDVFQKKLDTKNKILKNKGHFTQEENVTKLFEAFEEILNIDELSDHRKTEFKTDLEYESTKNL